MNNPLNAANPSNNAVVSASAGTGKTWMLTTRIIRLLLEGVDPNSILAITFTRKATAEMRQRVMDRVQALSLGGNTDELLSQMGVTPTQEALIKAKSLYEKLLNHPPVRTSTFHSFCQDLLQRFALEANVPPGFSLLEQAGVEIENAWEKLNTQATDHPNNTLSQALSEFFNQTKTLERAKTLAFEFVYNANDWLAYTQGQENPVEYAIKRLFEQCPVPDDVYAPLNHIDSLMAELAEQLNARSQTQAVTHYLHALGEARLQPDKGEHVFDALKSSFLTQSLTPRAYKVTNELKKRFGEEGAEQHVQNVQSIAKALLEVIEYKKRQTTRDLNAAWYRTGAWLLEAYQGIKASKKLLDFSDLEWKTYQLLKDPDNSEWVQYKIDQRIDHLLFDEFQDTNPTQWQLVKPLLEELAAGERDTPRSVFLVGDIKQSIYGFRRANPDLQVTASQWMEKYLNAQIFELSKSRRSSLAVIETVNAVFEQSKGITQIKNFATHSTFEEQSWGYVECLPLIISQNDPKVAADHNTPLRNPLLTPKPSNHYDHHTQEAEQIAQRIRELMDQKININSDQGVRPLRYSDIYVLFKKRTHLGEFERAFKQANIPFLGSAKGTFFKYLEVQDMECLLRFLMAPFDSYRLAVILRSPLFGATHDDLLCLARTDGGHWWDRLATLAQENTNHKTLTRAYTQLKAWIEKSNKLPVHDLIDHIFHTGHVLERFAQAVPKSQRAQTQANLIQFLHLALDNNSGRYPSLSLFLDSLKRLKSSYAKSEPDQASIDEGDDCVQLLTVHASKGMEAPVVFLVDTFPSKDDAPKAWESLIEWPSDKEKPTHFVLNPPKTQVCDLHQHLLENKSTRDSAEDANLLYVAMTRAKHMLIVSGSCKAADVKPDVKNWYRSIQMGLNHLQQHNDLYPNIQITSCLDNSDHANPDEADLFNQWLKISSGQPVEVHTQKGVTPRTMSPESQWLKENSNKPTHVLSPSQLACDEGPYSKRGQDESSAELAINIGLYTHALLEKLASNTGDALDTRMLERYKNQLSEQDQTICEQMAKNTYDEPDLAFIFKPETLQNKAEKQPDLFDSELTHHELSRPHSSSVVTKNEVEIAYTNTQGQRVFGVIDRLVIYPNQVWIVDYKSSLHIKDLSNDELIHHAQSYKPQLEAYAQGIQTIFPEKQVGSGIIFTAKARWVELS